MLIYSFFLYQVFLYYQILTYIYIYMVTKSFTGVLLSLYPFLISILYTLSISISTLILIYNLERDRKTCFAGMFSYIFYPTNFCNRNLDFCSRYW